MATIEQAEQLEQNATINASRDGFEMTIKAGAESGRKTVEALKALNQSLKSHRRDRKNKDDEPKQGKVSLKQFTRDAEGRREVVGIEDRKLVDEITRELKRHGVEFAVERRGKDQTRYFHVRGDDAGVVAHGIERAQERVDGMIARQQSKISVKERIGRTLDRMEDPQSKAARQKHERPLTPDQKQKQKPSVKPDDDDRKGPKR